MSTNLDNLSSLVYKETLRVIQETLDSQMGDNDDERSRQRKLAGQVKKRGLRASDNPEDLQKEQEDEEETEDQKDSDQEDLETGVPAASDDPEAAEPREDRTGGKGTSDSPKLKTPSRQQIKKATIGSVIDKLNALRGGRSLKDPKVKKSFTQYFNALSTGQRETLLVFMTGISQILAGVAQGDEAFAPEDVGLKSNVTKVAKKEKKKSSVSASEKNRPGTEMKPIIVGESRRPRHSLKRVIKTYKRNK